MAVTTVTINGAVIKPDGSPQLGGTIRIELSAAGSTDDSGTEQAIGGAFETPIDETDGTVNFTIVPNDVIDPAGTTYKATFRLPDGSEFKQTWSVDSTPTTQNIGDLD